MTDCYYISGREQQWTLPMLPVHIKCLAVCPWPWATAQMAVISLARKCRKIAESSDFLSYGTGSCSRCRIHDSLIVASPKRLVFEIRGRLVDSGPFLSTPVRH